MDDRVEGSIVENIFDEVAASDGLVRYNLGAGTSSLNGYRNLDIKDGEDAWPVDIADGSADEIRASHLLEHFAHVDVPSVLKHWIVKLKPGGLLKIAVPDFEWIAGQYRKGAQFPLQGYLMGGQTDATDFHKTVFDREYLHQVMADAGLERIGRWDDGHEDCSSLPVSLNLQGWKPVEGNGRFRVAAILSAPRFGPTTHFHFAGKTFQSLAIPYAIRTGAYWHQVLSEGIEELIDETDLIIVCDYDSVFGHEHVKELLRLMAAYPEVDAIMPVQYKRHDRAILGLPAEPLTELQLSMNLCPMKSGHFGLTVIRTSCFEKIEKPWFMPVPNEDAQWGPGRIDADVYFWKQFQAAGLNLRLAPKVKIGHIQESIVWPGEDYRPVYQDSSEYWLEGPPAGII